MRSGTARASRPASSSTAMGPGRSGLSATNTPVASRRTVTRTTSGRDACNMRVQAAQDAMVPPVTTSPTSDHAIATNRTGYGEPISSRVPRLLTLSTGDPRCKSDDHRHGARSPSADVLGLHKDALAAIVTCANSVWRVHGPTAEGHRPEPKGEGTVWRRQLIRPNRTLIKQSVYRERGHVPRKSARLGWA